MKKNWYDHKSVLCRDCAHHWDGGYRKTKLGMLFFPEGCQRYGYSFHDYPELADDCKGFQTQADVEAEERTKELLKKRNKK